jgi:hypothetical protein
MTLVMPYGLKDDLHDPAKINALRAGGLQRGAIFSNSGKFGSTRSQA